MNNTVTIDLASRYAAAFGMLEVNKQLNAAVVNLNQDYQFQFYGGRDIDVERTVFSYNDEKLVFAGMLTSGDSIFAPPLIVDFSREKSLIETQVSGSNTVIVERWGTKPWQLDIKGLCIDVEHRIYPESKIKILTRFFEINDIVDVEGIQFQDKQIDSIYFKVIKITPVVGFQDTVQFSLTASQIKPAKFYIL